MATDFDYGALWEGVCDIAMGSACGEENCQECQAAAAYLREQIEAALARVTGACFSGDRTMYRFLADDLMITCPDFDELQGYVQQALGADVVDYEPITKGNLTHRVRVDGEFKRYIERD